MIKPCPFCGGDGHVQSKKPRLYGVNGLGDKKVRAITYVWCGRCHARGPAIGRTVILTAENRYQIPVEMINDAVNAWNERSEHED